MSEILNLVQIINGCS